jgi:hypothetical protein
MMGWALGLVIGHRLQQVPASTHPVRRLVSGLGMMLAELTRGRAGQGEAEDRELRAVVVIGAVCTCSSTDCKPVSQRGA